MLVLVMGKISGKRGPQQIHNFDYPNVECLESINAVMPLRASRGERTVGRGVGDDALVAGEEYLHIVEERHLRGAGMTMGGPLQTDFR